MPNETLSTKESAEFLGVSDQTVLNMWKDGLLPDAYKINPSKTNSPLRIPKKNIEKILRARKNQRDQPGRK